MKGAANFVKTTAIGGFFVVLPVAIVLFLVGKVLAALVMAVSPLLEMMTLRQIGGVGIATLLAIVLFFALCFVTGLLIRTHFGKIAGRWVEWQILRKLPGYRIIKNLTSRFSGVEGTEFAPALVDLYGGDTRSLALIVEEQDDGGFTVFVPLAPTPTIGQVHVLPAAKVRKIEAPLGTVLNSFMQWGVESNKFLSGNEEASRDL
jgi:uncharacterized membrane protein